MTLKVTLAFLHFVALGLGFYGVWARAEALQNLKEQSQLSKVFKADNMWGLAALLWLITGIWRAFGGLEKGTDYYLSCTTFLLKFGLFILVFFLEIKPMVTLMKWRMSIRKGKAIDMSVASNISKISYIELIILFVIVFLATLMARGLGC